MTKYNNFNVILSNSQLNKLKLAIKNETDVVLRLSSISLVILTRKLIFLINYC